MPANENETAHGDFAGSFLFNKVTGMAQLKSYDMEAQSVEYAVRTPEDVETIVEAIELRTTVLNLRYPGIDLQWERAKGSIAAFLGCYVAWRGQNEALFT